MTTINMADLYAGAESEGFSGADLTHGTYDVKVKRTSVKSGEKGDRLLVTFESLDGAGTVLEGQSFNPNNKGMMFHWFRFLAHFQMGKEFFASNPTISVEQIGQFMVQGAERGQTFRIRYQPQEGSDQYSEVVILGPATGEGSVARTASTLPAVAPAPAPVPTSVQAAPPVALVVETVAPPPVAVVPSTPALGDGPKPPWEM